MANTTLLFNCNSGDGWYVETFLNTSNCITIQISDSEDEPYIVSLDKSTSIKFAKTLRTEINKIQE